MIASAAIENERKLYQHINKAQDEIRDSRFDASGSLVNLAQPAKPVEYRFLSLYAKPVPFFLNLPRASSNFSKSAK